MAYLVSITARAECDLAYLYAETGAERPDAALKWYRALKEAIPSLEGHPRRCPITHENPNLRHLLYGRKPHIYRVIYRLDEMRKRVDVLHIRHGDRASFKPSEVA